MRSRRYRQKGNWFVPGLVATAFMAVVAWQMGWFPVKMARTETGTLLSELQQPTDTFNGNSLSAPGTFQPGGAGAGQSAAGANGNPFQGAVDMTGLPDQSEPDQFDAGTSFDELNRGGTEFDRFTSDNPFEDAELESSTGEVRTASQDFDANAFESDDFPSDQFQSDGAQANTENPFAVDDLDLGDFEPAPAAVEQVQPADYSAVVRSSADDPAGFSATGESQTTTPGQFQTEQPAMPIATAAIEKSIRMVDQLLTEDDFLTAHSELSKIYWQQPEYRPLIKTRIEETARSIYASPQPHYVKPYVVRPGDQLRKIAERYKVPWQYLASLNQVDERKVQAGKKLKVNKGPFSALVDLSDFELIIHAHGFFVHRYQVGVGKNGTSPIGRFKVQQKLTNPTYYGPDGLVIDGDDARNPLGEHWIDLGDSYGIHGTIDPDSIGQARSRGCIRLRNEDVADVFNLLAEGSEVIIRR